MTNEIALSRPSDEQIFELFARLGFPQPDVIKLLSDSTGAYHSIFMITYAESEHAKTVVLRISDPRIPHIKTQNEVSVMKWVQQHTKVVLPMVVAFDATYENPLRAEYTILEHREGAALSSLIANMSPADRLGVVDQIIDVCVQLYAHSWNHVGGLQIQLDGKHDNPMPGPMIDAHFWTVGDSKLLSEPLSHNVYGPHVDAVAACAAQMKALWLIIQMHGGLTSMRSCTAVPDLLVALDISTNPTSVLAQKFASGPSPRYVLAHRDLHLGNILYDTTTGRITAILDWELAAVVPYPQWNPGNFLWVPGSSEKVGREVQQDLVRIFKERVESRQLQYLLEETEWKSHEMKMLHRAATLLKWIVNGGVRGWERNKMKIYRAELEECIRVLLDIAAA